MEPTSERAPGAGLRAPHGSLGAATRGQANRPALEDRGNDVGLLLRFRRIHGGVGLPKQLILVGTLVRVGSGADAG